MNLSEKKQIQIAVYALLNGTSQASDLYLLETSQILQLIETLPNDPIPIFTVIRHEILDCLKHKGLKATSDIWNLSHQTLQKLSKAFPSPPSSPKFIDSECSITPKDFKSYTSVYTAPIGSNDEASPKKKRKTGEDKRKVTNYTIEQKILAVIEFVKGSNQSETARELQIPAVNLMRWRDKIRKEAFQEAHVENLYGVQKRGQRNKMFRDLDLRVHEWCKGKGSSDDEIIEKAKSLVRIDDVEPVVKDVWLQSFKKYFKL